MSGQHRGAPRSSRLAKTALALAVAGLQAPGAFAEPGPIGREFRVNVTTKFDQWHPAIAGAADGRFVVTWQHDDADIHARVFTAAGEGTTLTIANSTDKEYQPDIAMDDAGNFVAVWTRTVNGVDDIFARRYTATTQQLSAEFRVASTATTGEARTNPHVAMDTEGNFVIGWTNSVPLSSTRSVRTQRYNAAGATVGAALSFASVRQASTNAPLTLLDVAMNAGGDYVVLWSAFKSEGTGPGDGVARARRVSAAGVAGPGLAIETGGRDNLADAVVDIQDGTGDFVVAWSNDEGLSFFMQRYSSESTTKGLPVIINPGPSSGSSPIFDLGGLALDASGEMVVTYERTDPTVNNSLDIFAQRFDSNDVPSPAFRVHAPRFGTHREPVVAVDADGDAVVAWTDWYMDGSGRGVYARRFRGAQMVDVDAQLFASRSQAFLNEPVEYTAVISNLNAPEYPTGFAWVDAAVGSALDTRLALTISSDSTVVATPTFVPGNAGLCYSRSTGYVCDLNDPLGAGQQARIAFKLSSSAAGPRTTIAKASTKSFDDDTTNNRDTATTTYACNPGVLEFTSTSYAAPENTGVTSQTFAVRRTGGSCGSVSVWVDTNSGTAVAGPDFTDTSQVLTWGNGDTTNRVLATQIVDDAIDEANESFQAVLSNATGGASIGAIGKTRITITDNDATPQVNFTSTGQTVTEETALLSITASLSTVSGRNVSIPLTLSGTATSTSDYQLTEVVLTIPAGSKTASVDLLVKDDADVEGAETAIVSMGTPTNATAGFINSHTVTITNDD